MTYEQAQDALLLIARRNGGVITAKSVEADETLAQNQEVVSAAARAFAGSTNVFDVPREAGDDGGWFPFAELRITVL